MDTQTPTAPKSGRHFPPALMMVIGLMAVLAPAIIGFILIRTDDGGGSATDSVGEMADASMGAGPTSGGAQFAGVSPMEDILVGDPTLEFEAAGAAAVVRLSTSIDVVCAVAYGPTPSLGSLATDTDMAGGGHSDHQPKLRGLHPGATYFYRLYAIDAGGRLYASNTATFRFPDGSSSPGPPGQNLAAGATVVDVSSEYSAAFGAARAVDGDLGTEWATAGDGDNAHITLDLGEIRSVVAVGFRTRAMSDGTSITTSFTITVDGERTFGPFDTGPGLTVAPVEFTGRTVRFDVETSTGGNTGAIEIEVYGKP